MSANNLRTVMENSNKEYGQGTIVHGTDLKKDPPRLPFGVFSVDFATGGGCPLWGTTCLWGPESGGKTSLAMNAVSMAGRICWRCFNLSSFCTCSSKPLFMRTLWADIEGTYDSEWSHAIGTDPEKYFLALADYGEMYVDVADSALKADDCGLVVGDSLAALMPIREFEAASEDQYLGAQARMIGKCVRKLKQRMIRERKRGHPCTIIFTNQMRKKIGEMFGNPETMAGGHGMMHEFSLLIRTVQKGLTETDKKKFSGEKGKKDFATRHSFLIKKMKVLTLASSGEFVRLTDSVKEADMEKGEIDDYATVMNYAKTYGVVEKDGDSWRLLGKKAKRQSDIIQYWKKFPDEYYKASRAIIQKAKEQLADA